MEKDRFSDLRLEQIRHASVLILSKSEHLEESEIARFHKALHELSPEAEIITGDYTALPDAFFGAVWSGSGKKKILGPAGKKGKKLTTVMALDTLMRTAITRKILWKRLP